MERKAGRRFTPDAPALWGAALGAVLFLLIYGPSILNVTYDSWIYNGYIGVDILQHQAGWAAFRAGEWAFPLTFTGYLNWPAGGPAALADCVPLFAIPFKLLDGVLPATFQYFGWFNLFCMAMAGWAGAKLLGQFGLAPGARVLGSVLFSAAPVLLERAFQHSGLAAQFLVIWALYLYFRTRRSGFARLPWGFVGLAAAAAFTHVYLVPMVLAIAFAAAVDGVAVRRAWRAALPLLGSVAAAATAGFALGYFASYDYVPGGFGNFGVNLNTFWNPASYNWPTWDASYQHLRWSRFLPSLPVVGDSTGSFSYLGLGVLCALLVCGVGLAVRLLRKNGVKGSLAAGWGLVKTHPGLIFACLCLAVFAVSNVVTANSRTLLTIPLPEAILRLCDIFRSSGRMIWPIYYLLVLCAVLGVCALMPKGRKGTASYGVIGNTKGKKAQVMVKITGWLNRREAKRKGRRTGGAALVALAVLLVVQFADLSPALAEKHRYFAQRVVPQSYAAPAHWAEIAKPSRVLYQLELNEDRVTALRAASAAMPTNYFLLARGTPAALLADMEKTLASLRAGKLPDFDAVFITSDPALAAELKAALDGVCKALPFEQYTAFLPFEAVAPS